MVYHLLKSPLPYLIACAVALAYLLRKTRRLPMGRPA